MNLKKEQDIERLRQTALLLHQENTLLHKRLAQLAQRLDVLTGQDAASLQLEIETLKAQLENSTPKSGGKGSERRRRRKNKGEQERKPKSRQGPTPQPELPREELLCELDEADMCCPACGGELTEMEGQFEEAEMIDVVERRFVIKQVKRQKYVCSCGSCVETAPAPLKVRSKGRYSLMFAISIVVAKYGDHLPLERQVRQMKRSGLAVTTSTLWDQIEGLAYLVTPSYRALLPHLREHEGCLRVDESSWPVLGHKRKRWTIWTVASPSSSYFVVAPKRDHVMCLSLVEDYLGVVMCDGLSVYTKARDVVRERDGPGFELAHCWAHVRRKLIEAEPNYPEATVALDLIGELYGVERSVVDVPEAQRCEALMQARQEQSSAIIDKLEAWKLSVKTLPKSALGVAIRYMEERKAGLTVFLSNADVPLGRVDARRGIRQDPFPGAARRTGRAALPHPALVQDMRPSLSAG